MSEWTEEDHNEVSIIVNGEVIAKASGPSPSLDLIRGLTNEIRRHDDASITEEWLKASGFKWHQLSRQPEKHWLLWLGDCVAQGNYFRSYDDLGIVLASNSDGRWNCWLRDDAGGLYSRFIHVRYLSTQAEILQLIEALTDQAWNIENNLYGSMRSPAQAAALRKDYERIDRKMIQERAPWRPSEKDDSQGRALPEHMEAYDKANLKDRKDL